MSILFSESTLLHTDINNKTFISVGFLLIILTAGPTRCYMEGTAAARRTSISRYIDCRY